LETVPSFGGVFYDEPAEDQIARAIEQLEQMEPGVRPEELQTHARRFSEAEFLRKMTEVLSDAAWDRPPGLSFR
jgi:hypothetical protein